MAFCLICASLLGTVVRADDSGTIYNVSSPYEFMDAVSSAGDGDTISINGYIEIDEPLQIGDESKHLTISRSDATSYISFNGSVDVVNVTFEGQGIKSSYSFVISNSEATFTDCIFQNCGESGSLSGSGSVGGAVKVQSGSSVFSNCIFSNNHAVGGGSVAVMGDSQVKLQDCTIYGSSAVSCGGAVTITSSSAACEINGGEITGNQAGDVGGGVSNAGALTVTGAKIYGNSAGCGGADIATKVTGNTTLTDTVEQLNELFSAENIEVTGWVCDYDFETGLDIPDVEPTQENALLKLSYTIIEQSDPDTETEEPTTPDEPDEDDQTGDDQQDESTGSGDDEADQSGDSDDGSGDNPDQSGDDSSGDSDQTDADNNTDNPDEDDQGDSSTDDQQDSGADVSDSEGDAVDAETGTSDSVTDEGSTYTDNGVTNENGSVTSSEDTDTDTDDSSSSVNNSSVVNNSDTDRSDNSSYTSTTTTTTNNYYSTAAASPEVVIEGREQQEEQPVSSGAITAVSDTGESTAQVQETQEQGTQDTQNTAPNIRIDAQGVDCVFEFVDGEYNISISSAQAAADSSTDEAAETEKSVIEWYQIIQCLLLGAVLICAIWRGKSRE